MNKTCEAERERIKNLWRYENELYGRGALHIAGVDEAGRGPLAGPVVAACVILKQNDFLPGVDDSKKISELKRGPLADMIKARAVCYSIAEVGFDVIDRVNILNATHEAMRRAISGMAIAPGHVLIDGLAVPDAGFTQTAIIKGDSLSLTIAAASIVAKVTRDEMMRGYHEIYPEYGFDQHKGYGTGKHIKAIRERGLCPIHRRSFSAKFAYQPQA